MIVPVEARRAYRLLNHGPTTLVTTAHAGERNVMAAAWVMPIDFDPARVAVVIASGTRTRELVDRSGELVLQVPTVELRAVTHAVGNESGHDVDKFERHGLRTRAASVVGAPLVEDCVAWLECRVLPEEGVQSRYDLFVCEVVAAFADDRVFDGRVWRFDGEGSEKLRSLHHVAGGAFFTTAGPLP